MNNRFYLSAFFVVYSLFSSFGLYAQEEQNQGEIEDVQVEIVKDREIVLPPAVRKFDKVPPATETQETPEVTYAYPLPRISVSPLELRLRPLRIKDEPLQKTYGNYVAAGFGNYATPYLEAFLNSKREKSLTYGAHGKYLSSYKGPVDGTNSGNGLLEVDLFGSYFGRAASLSGDLGFRRRFVHFYGYDPAVEVDSDTLEQHYNHVFAEAVLAGTDAQSPVDYRLTFKADNISDNLDMNEAHASIEWDGSYDLNDDAAFILNFSYDYFNFKNNLVDGVSRHLFKVQPRVQFVASGISLIAGLNAAYENDTLGGSQDLHIYPHAEATYALTEQWKIFAQLSGDIDQVSYSELTYANPFLGPGNRAFHSNRTFDLSGGIKGRLSQTVGVMAGYSLEAYKNLYFFIPSDQQPALNFYNNQDTRRYWYSAVYDQGTTNIFSLYGQVSVNVNEDLYANVKAEWSSYGTDEIRAAYHRPEWNIQTDVFYQLFDKINLTANFYGIGGITAINEEGNDFTLDPAIDLNFKADYLLSDRASFFLQFNNILSNDYMLLYRYPVRGFQVMGGVTYNF